MQKFFFSGILSDIVKTFSSLGVATLLIFFFSHNWIVYSNIISHLSKIKAFSGNKATIKTLQ